MNESETEIKRNTATVKAYGLQQEFITPYSPEQTGLTGWGRPVTHHEHPDTLKLDSPPNKQHHKLNVLR